MKQPAVQEHPRLGTVAAVSAALTVLVVALAAQATGPRTDGSRSPMLPPLARGEHPLIAAAGDIACSPSDSAFNLGRGTPGRCRHRDTAGLLGRRSYDAILALGDLQYELGAPDAFENVFARSWGRFPTLRPVPGNHEYETAGASGYFDVLGSRAGDPGTGYYSFDLGAWHLVALNSNCDEIGGCGEGSPQLTWLRADLAANPAPCVLAFWHHPRWSSGSTHGGDLRTDAFWRELSAARADVVLVGHEHHYERFARLDAAGRPSPRGVRQFTVGTGGKSHYGFAEPVTGSQVRSDKSYGVLELVLQPLGYRWRFLPATGRFVDTGSARCVR